MHKLYNVLAQKLYIINKYAKKAKEGDVLATSYMEKNIYCLNKIEKKYFPHGSGFDDACYLDLDKSKMNKLVISFNFHPIDNGRYAEWIDLEVIIVPDLRNNYSFKINWKGYRGKFKYILGDFLQDVWSDMLETEVPLKDRTIPIN